MLFEDTGHGEFGHSFTVIAEEFGQDLIVVGAPHRPGMARHSIGARQAEPVLFGPTRFVHRVRYFVEVVAMHELRVDDHLGRVLDPMGGNSSGLQLAFQLIWRPPGHPPLDQGIDLADAFESLVQGPGRGLLRPDE